MIEANEVTSGPWEWRGDQLFSRVAQMTLLRDVKFWNMTSADKKTIAASPVLRGLLIEARQYVADAGDNEEPGEHQVRLLADIDAILI